MKDQRALSSISLINKLKKYIDVSMTQIWSVFLHWMSYCHPTTLKNPIVYTSASTIEFCSVLAPLNLRGYITDGSHISPVFTCLYQPDAFSEQSVGMEVNISVRLADAGSILTHSKLWDIPLELNVYFEFLREVRYLKSDVWQLGLWHQKRLALSSTSNWHRQLFSPSHMCLIHLWIGCRTKRRWG